jgi:hypothetical protein
VADKLSITKVHASGQVNASSTDRADLRGPNLKKRDGRKTVKAQSKVHASVNEASVVIEITVSRSDTTDTPWKMAEIARQLADNLTRFLEEESETKC